MVSPSKKRKERKGRENDDTNGTVGFTFGSKSKQSGRFMWITLGYIDYRSREGPGVSIALGISQFLQLRLD